jgi:hypothetical protein
MTVQLARIAARFDGLHGHERDVPHSHPKVFVPEGTADLAEAERLWPPAWRLVLIVGTSAGLWLLILVSLSIAGVVRLLP